MIIRLLTLSLLLITIRQNTCAQRITTWITYSQAQFVKSPGLELDVFLFKRFGVHAGGTAYFQKINPEQVINIEHQKQSGLFKANLGMSMKVYKCNNHQIGISAGVTSYLGPNYQLLLYYEKGGYKIFHDASRGLPNFHLDLGIFYFYKRITSLIKFDFARNNVRGGIGYIFGKKKLKPADKP